MKATQSYSKNSEEEKLIAFTAKVEQDAISSVSRGSYFSDDVLSCYASFAPKDETDRLLSDIDVKGDYIIDELIKFKKCNIILLKRLTENEEMMLQFHESEVKWEDIKEENESLLTHLKEVEFNMENVLELNAKLQNNVEYLINAHGFLIKNVIRLEDEVKKA